MKIVLISCVVALCHAVSYQDLFQEEWNLFKVQFNKQYQNETEENYRMNIFMENKLKIIRHNKRYEDGVVSFKMKVTQFADMSNSEFRSKMRCYNRSTAAAKSRPSTRPTFIPPENMKLPTTFDWREKGAVTPVKNQGRCGSCYAFSATGSLEGQHFRKTGKLVSLSEQNIIDCTEEYGNGGCCGGFPEAAFEYIKDNDGIDTEDSYPYEQEVQKCRYDPKNKGATDTGFMGILQQSEDELMAAVGTHGPVSVAIDARHDSFQHYGEGVYFEPECDEFELVHAVLAVGFGISDKGEEYWIVKNSWGETWGNKGYILMRRNKDNHCGISTDAVLPLV